MKKLKLITGLLILCLSVQISAQVKSHVKELKVERSQALEVDDLKPIQSFFPAVPRSERGFSNLTSKSFQSLPTLIKPQNLQPNFQILKSSEKGLPIAIKGHLEEAKENLEEQSFDYLKAVKDAIQIETPEKEFSILKTTVDDLGHQHLRLQQEYQGIPIYGAEVILHAQDGKIEFFNGRYFPTPDLETIVPTLVESSALEIVLEDLETKTTVKTLSDFEKNLIPEESLSSELMIFHKDKNADEVHLAWHFTVYPNVSSKWSYLIDAHSGEILHHFNHVCQFAGEHDLHHCSSHTNLDKVEEGFSELPPPGVANEVDLLGFTRSINVWQEGGNFFMIDGAREMYQSAPSNMPDDPVGVIWTIDAQNTAPQNNDFGVAHVVSGNNNWNNPLAVSAHYNGGQAYEYFRETFGRNSINGQGGNIVSIINVADESGGDMDNAFWNGAAMFYGNGDQAFTDPLAKALDVAGHEMSHGVIQNTANLEYFGESGALNESFADIFGAMIDRDDWNMGEEVVNTSIFSSGALRSLSDPHNGGNSLGDPGYQPKHVDEQFFGSQDNGGVHINSGIPNHAYYLYATEIGKDKAEQIFYRALDNYLVKSSQFVDLRIAVIQSATDLHGSNSNEVTAAQNAFAAVGIGSGPGTDSQTDVEVNDGEEYILMSDPQLDQLYIYTPDGTAISNPLTSVSPISKPSITDDGSAIVYVAANKTIQAITIDWANGSAQQFDLSSDAVWRNVAISKDGSLVAALTDDLDNRLWVFDLINETSTTFDLVNPTTADGGATTGNVEYADVLEFDFTGEWVMYDALNSITNATGQDIEYWDVGFVRVFDYDTDNFSDGFISKLFSGLPENTSVGNPTFSKNSDFIIAFDFIDEFENEYNLMGANVETGDVGTIFNNVQLSYPNYSVQDDEIIFDAVAGIFNDDVLGKIAIGSDKISAAGDGEVFFEDRKWGVWFADGERVLTGVEDQVLDNTPFKIFPNPFEDNLTIEFDQPISGALQIEVFDLLGKQILQKEYDAFNSNLTVELEDLPSGSYFLKLSSEGQHQVVKVLKN